MEVVLASKSPRRRQLLLAAGLAVEILPSHVDELMMHEETVEETVCRLARLKSDTCQEVSRPVIAADTLVCLKGKAFGQPKDLEEARLMIQALAGQKHNVFTGVCIRYGDQYAMNLVRTDVHFRNISEREIKNYLAHNEVMDKAGAYAVQAGASSFITRIDGPLDNVIGLPVHSTMEMLLKLAMNKGESLHEY